MDAVTSQQTQNYQSQTALHAKYAGETSTSTNTSSNQSAQCICRPDQPLPEEQVKSEMKQLLTLFMEMASMLMQLLQRLMSGKPGGTPPGGEIPTPGPQPTPAPAPSPAPNEPVLSTPVEKPSPAPDASPPISTNPSPSPTPAPTAPSPTEAPSAPEEAPAPVNTEAPSKPESDDFKTYVRELLNKAKGQKVNEERFQYGIAHYLLNKEDPKAAEAFEVSFKEHRAKLKGKPNATEDAVKLALKDIVDQGLISKKKAREINGLSFAAAQLDDNKQALYDGRGQTSAKMGINKALNRALAVIEGHMSGESPVEPRNLNAPSTKVDEVKGTSGASSSGDISNEFLWKPQSDHGKKLVVLLPNKFNDQVDRVAIYSDLPPSADNKIGEDGRFTGDEANGNRGHYRFNRAGGEYPNNVYVVAHMKDGSTESFPIGNSADRN